MLGFLSAENYEIKVRNRDIFTGGRALMQKLKGYEIVFIRHHSSRTRWI
jgi:hypothetical protein